MMRSRGVAGFFLALAAVAGIAALLLRHGPGEAPPGADARAAGALHVASGTQADHTDARDPIAAAIQAGLATSDDPRERAILRALEWLRRFGDSPLNMQAVFTDYVLMLNELTTRPTHPAVRPIAAAMLRRAFARASGDLPLLFTDSESGKFDYSAILFMVPKWDLDEEPFIRFYRGWFPPRFSVDFTGEFAIALRARDYDRLSDVLITTSFFHHYRQDGARPRVRLPDACFPCYLERLERLPYVHTFESDPDAYSDQNYFVTHIVFAAMHYGEGAAPRGPLMDQVAAYLNREFDTVRHRVGDLDLLAEFVHGLKILGHGETPRVRGAVDYILGLQNRDGSWGNPADADSPYDAFHPTWAVVVALNY